MSGPGGINPAIVSSPQNTPTWAKGVNPEVLEEKQEVSIFHRLDSNKDNTIDKNESHDTIFSKMQTGANTETINISSGSGITFKSLYEAAMQKFQDIQYESNYDSAKGVNSVENKLASQANQFNMDAGKAYTQALQQRNNEAKGELSADKSTLEYKDAAGETFRTENVTVETKDGTTFYKNSAGKTIYYESDDGSQNTSMYNSDGNLISSSTRDSGGNVTDSASYTYNEQGQRTSRTYTSQGQTFTSEFTYNPNGTMASEIVKDADGNVVETTLYDKNGQEVSYDAVISDETSTTHIEQEFNKKGNLKSSTHSVSMNDGSASSISTETFRKNGTLKTRDTYFNTTDPNALNTSFNTHSTFRRGGELKYETIQTRGNDGTATTSKTKFRGDGETRKWTQTGVYNGDGTTTAFRENFNIDDEIRSGKTTIRDKNGKVIDKNKLIVFDNNNYKVPQGYTAVKGFDNHYSNSKGEVFVFVKGDNNKPTPVRDHSTTARMHEARLKREIEAEQE